jgi:tripartite-type tricarboxylate transporter receptor subunit TctC
MKLPHRRQFLYLAVGVAALPAAPSIAGAQTFPSRPITIVVGAAAGGATDVIARMMAERLKSSLGQPVIVEDVTGAGGTIAAGRVARAAYGQTANTSSPALPMYSSMTYSMILSRLPWFQLVRSCSPQERRCRQMT